MASSSSPKINSFLAGAAISKGMAVKFGSDEKHVVKGAANTDRVIGIAQNAPSGAEEFCEVARPGGGAKGLLGENVTKGKFLVAHTDGTLVKANAAADVVIAVAMEDGSSGELIDVEVVMFLAAAAD